MALDGHDWPDIRELVDAVLSGKAEALARYTPEQRAQLRQAAASADAHARTYPRG